MKIKIFLLIFLSFLAIECNKIEDFVDNGNTETTEEEDDKNKNDKDKIDIATTQLIFNETKSDDVIIFTTTYYWSADLINDRAANWITISPKNGKAGQSKINISVSENSLYDDRSATIQIRCGSVKKDITIVQKQKNALTVTSSKFEVDAEGGFVNVEVKSNIDFNWDISNASRSWIKYFGTKAIESHMLQFSISENTDISNREGEIVLTGLTGNKLSETIKIYQSGVEPSIILTQDKYNVSDVESVIKVEIKSNVDVSVKIPDNVDWITEDKDKSASTNTYYFTVAENNQGVERKTKISFKNEEFSIIKDVEIVQSSMPNIYVETAGNLGRLIRESNYDNCGRLKISGILNIDDFFTIFSMKNLFYLDISDVVIKILPGRDVGGGNESFFERIEQIVLPKTLTKMDVGCFYECSKLQSINVPENVTSISGFENCENLKSVVFSNSSNLLEIGVRCFDNCKSLRSFVVPKNVWKIGENAFAYSSLENIIFEDNSALTQIGSYAFYNTKITSIVIPKNVLTIDAEAFSACKNLNTVIFEKESRLEALYNDNETVSDNASIGGVFSYCTSLKNIELPSYLEHIGTSTFYGCTSLEKIEIPSKVDALRRMVFGECSSLKEVSFAPNSQLSLICDDYRIGFSKKNSAPFAGCKKLEIVNAKNCRLLTRIGKNAFGDSNIITKFILGTIEPPKIEKDTFSNSNIGFTTLLVPTESVEEYKQSTLWSAKFDNIVGF